MSPRYQASLGLLPLLLWGALTTAAENFVLDPERAVPRDLAEGSERKEGAVTLPPWPQGRDLIAFVPDGPRTPFRYLIDGKNLHIDATGSVVRYTLVIESANGTRNVSHEGIRCTLQGAWKTYAYGSDGRFILAPAADWQPLARDGSDAYREDLQRHRFCVPRETRPRPVKDMLRALRGRVSANESTGFQAD